MADNPFSWALTGVKEMKKKILGVAKQFPDKVAAALYQEAQVEMTESKRRCPVAVPSWYLAQGYGRYRGIPGSLRASGRVAEPERGVGRIISVTLSYGGYSAPYAIYVHEIEDNYHPIGQWKYLESVINESRPYMAARVARRLEKWGVT